ncbi:unnamed protein product [Cyprideis torosa]|nr:unnamed protein product [Cyprideis torosa]CAG0885644.1 unnamed protein product [Cyprideis torosa]
MTKYCENGVMVALNGPIFLHQLRRWIPWANFRRYWFWISLISALSMFGIVCVLRNREYIPPRRPPFPLPPPPLECPNIPHRGQDGADVTSSWDDTNRSQAASLKFDAKVLFFSKTRKNLVAEWLVENKFRYREISFDSKTLPVLTDSSRGKYLLIVFEDFEQYLKLDKWNRQLLDKYCKDYDVGVIGFLPGSFTNSVPTEELLEGLPLMGHTGVLPKSVSVDPSPIPRILKGGLLLPVNASRLPPFTTFRSHSGYRNVLTSRDPDQAPGEALVLEDEGEWDGVRRVLFGMGLEFWPHRILFLDALHYLSRGKVSTPMYR